MPIVTALTAAVLALLQIKLALNVIVLRRRHRIGIGDGGDEMLERAVRVHGNAAEYIPIALILLGCLELIGGPRWLLVPLALGFTVGRVLHARGVASATSPLRDRVIGMHLTLWSIVALAVLNILQVVRLAFG